MRASPSARQPWGRARSAAVAVVLVVPALAAAMLAVQAARASEQFGPVSVTLTATAAVRADTRLATVLGDQVLDRHLGPGITARVDEIAVEPVLSAAVSDQPVERIRTEIERDQERTRVRFGPVALSGRDALLVRFGVQLLVLAAVAAVTAFLAMDALLAAKGWGLAHPLRWALVTGLGVSACLAAVLLMTRDTSATERTGWLAYGADRTDVLARLDEFDERYARTGRYILALIESVDDREQVREEPAACIVAVSDVHSRNVYPLIRSTVDAFSCTVAVVDGGDFVDWGEDFESRFFDQPDRVPFRRLRTSISDLGVPYLVVRGNHDSDSTMSALRAAGARELAGRVVEVGGLRVAGQGLPRDGDASDLFTPDDGPDEDRRGYEEAQDRIGEELADLASRRDTDVAVVHYPRSGELLFGDVPVVVTGHTHRQSTRTVDDTFHLQLGSVGGAGLRSFDTAGGEPLAQQWAVIKFDRSCRLLGVTLLSADSLGGGDIVATEVVVERDEASDGAAGQGGAGGRTCGAGR